MNAHLVSIAYHLPDKFQSNADLAAENPEWDLAQIESRTGVLGRHVAAPDETALDLAREACAKLFAAPAFDGRPCPHEVDAIVFCTQSPDYVMPSNAHLLHAALGLPDQVLAFDFNLACSGYVYGLALAQSLIHAGLASTLLLVTADTYSKYINPRDRSVRALFGDGAAATLLVAASEPAEFRGFELWSRGRDFESFYIPGGGRRQPASAAPDTPSVDRHGNERRPCDIHMDGMAIWAFVNSAVPTQIKALLTRTQLDLASVDVFAFHQASRMTLDSLTKVLGVPREKVITNLAQVGNTVSASLPILLKDSIASGAIREGQRVLMAGFGVGLSYGSTVWEFGGRQP